MRSSSAARASQLVLQYGTLNEEGLKRIARKAARSHRRDRLRPKPICAADRYAQKIPPEQETDDLPPRIGHHLKDFHDALRNVEK